MHVKEITDRTEWINGTEFTRGDYAIAVNWWRLTADDVEDRTYGEWEPSQEDIEAYGIETSDGTSP